jgi:hypothetical protein
MDNKTRVFNIKSNDTLPALSVKIKARNCINAEISFDLTGATACTFSMADTNGNLKISSNAALITSYSGGTVQYNWTSEDTDTVGKFRGEFEITFSDGNKLSVPSFGYIDIHISEDINGL